MQKRWQTESATPVPFLSDAIHPSRSAIILREPTMYCRPTARLVSRAHYLFMILLNEPALSATASRLGKQIKIKSPVWRALKDWKAMRVQSNRGRGKRGMNNETS